MNENKIFNKNQEEANKNEDLRKESSIIEEEENPEEKAESIKNSILENKETFIKEGEDKLENISKQANAIGVEGGELLDLMGEENLTSQVNQVNNELELISNKSINSIDLATKDSKIEASDEDLSSLLASFSDNESAYLKKKGETLSEKGAIDFKERYNDKENGAEAFYNQVDAMAEKSGVSKEDLPELVDKSFDSNTKEIILNHLKSNIDKLLLNKETARHNPEKHDIVAKQTERYLSLVEQAQKEGDIDSQVKAQDILNLVQDNINLTVHQDLVASENTLGDHGIRHIMGYNIKITEEVLNNVEQNGQEVKAIDRIMGHQIMMMHDIGYATQPVRERINKGDFSADKGHNLLSAKVFKEKINSEDNYFSKVFSKNDLATIHEGILEHDDSKVEIDLNNKTEAARKENLISAIHLADNSHAFEDKLPEVMYNVPDSLETMRLLKAAGEIGDDVMINELKDDLIKKINKNENYSEDDKEALSKSVNSLNTESYRFSVGRICGNNPEIKMDKNGKISIAVEESAIHQETVALFNMKAYDQLKKLVADIQGIEKSAVSEEMLNSGKIEGEKVSIELKIGSNKSEKKTDYQERIEKIIKNKEFRFFATRDDSLSNMQKRLKYKLENENDSANKELLKDKLEKVKKLRKQIYNNYKKE